MTQADHENSKKALEFVWRKHAAIVKGLLAEQYDTVPEPAHKTLNEAFQLFSVIDARPLLKRLNADKTPQWDDYIVKPDFAIPAGECEKVSRHLKQAAEYLNLAQQFEMAEKLNDFREDYDANVLPTLAKELANENTAAQVPRR